MHVLFSMPGWIWDSERQIKQLMITKSEFEAAKSVVDQMELSNLTQNKADYQNTAMF